MRLKDTPEGLHLPRQDDSLPVRKVHLIRLAEVVIIITAMIVNRHAV
jgi:hypothetical protein